MQAVCKTSSHFDIYSETFVLKKLCSAPFNVVLVTSDSCFVKLQYKFVKPEQVNNIKKIILGIKLSLENSAKSPTNEAKKIQFQKSISQVCNLGPLSNHNAAPCLQQPMSHF